MMMTLAALVVKEDRSAAIEATESVFLFFGCGSCAVAVVVVAAPLPSSASSVPAGLVLGAESKRNGRSAIGGRLIIETAAALDDHGDQKYSSRKKKKPTESERRSR